MKTTTEYYELVPKGLEENLLSRQKVLEACSHDMELRQELWKMCRRDMLFWVNMFTFTFDPRTTLKKLPFITYGYQDDGFLVMNECCGNEDLGIRKSRDMGASWMMLTLFLWRWIFYPLQSFMLMSRIEDLVDKRNEPDCLFWKIDFILDNLPGWMVPKRERAKLALYNKENESSITGSSTTSDAGRGGRKTCIAMDEIASVPDSYGMMSATASNTDSRFFNSTPKGSGNAFYDKVHDGTTKILTFHWSQHPVKSVGIYIDKAGKQRSKWYDVQCKRAAHPSEIAQELDMDFLGSDFQFFSPDNLQEVSTHVMPPMSQGVLDFNRLTAEPIAFAPLGRGSFHIWHHLDSHGRPPSGRSYVIGCDIATGTGASNTSFHVIDEKTGEQVGEWNHAKMRPDEAASMAVAFAKWYRGSNKAGAFLIWEANGPGQSFGNRVIELGYRNVYYRQQPSTLAQRKTKSYGWWANKDTKLDLFGEFRRALHSGEYTPRSKHMIQECRHYVYTQTGTVEHARAMSTVDPTGAKDNHGDRVTAAALAWKGTTVKPILIAETQSIPEGSLMHRRMMAEEAAQQGSRW